MSKVAKEVAEKEVADWLRSNDIPMDSEKMNDDEAGNFDSSKGVLVRAMMAGALRIESGKLKYTLNTPPELLKELSFREFTAGDLASMSSSKGKETESLIRLAARLGGVDYKLIMNIKGRDLSFVLAAVSLLLGSLQSSW